MAAEQRVKAAKSGFDRETLTINGVKTTVLTAGSGQPLVFLHGAGTFHGFDFALRWADKFKVMVPYHPGFGESADDNSISEIHDYVLHYLDLFDQLKLRDVNLVGHSLGGWIAAEFAMEHSERLRKLVLVSPAGLRDPAHPSTDIFTILPEEMPAYLVVDKSILTAGMPQEPDVEFVINRYRETTSAARVLWERPYSVRLPRWLHRVNVPTLLLWGEQDRIIPAKQSETWSKLIPDSKVIVVRNAGHLVLDEKPEAVDRVAAFLQEA